MSRKLNKSLLLLIIKAGYAAYKAYCRDKKRLWMKKYYKERNLYGWFETSFPSLKSDPELFFETVRVSPGKFDILLGLLKKKLTKNSFRRPIKAECRLFLTLEYLAQGGSRQVYARKYRIAKCTIGNIILETCSVIWDELRRIYLAGPNKKEWFRISTDYKVKCGLSNCLGAIDGKLIPIICPINSRTDPINYKKRFSIVLLAACDTNYTFTVVDIKAVGSQSESGVFNNSFFWKKFANNEMNIPEYAVLPKSNLNFPYFFVAANGFTLKKYLMCPFRGKNVNDEQICYNRRISRAQSTIENTFGILACRWRVLLNGIYCNPTNAENIVKACVVLHNYLRLNEVLYCPEGYADNLTSDNIVPGLWRNEPCQLKKLPSNPTNKISREAFTLRQQLTEYLFNN